MASITATDINEIVHRLLFVFASMKYTTQAVASKFLLYARWPTCQPRHSASGGTCGPDRSERAAPRRRSTIMALPSIASSRYSKCATRSSAISPTGAPLHERNVSGVFYSICKIAGIPRLRFHYTRHTCGMLLHVLGADLFVIQEVLGHSQLSTRWYTHVPTDGSGHRWPRRTDERLKKGADGEPGYCQTSSPSVVVLGNI